MRTRYADTNILQMKILKKRLRATGLLLCFRTNFKLLCFEPPFIRWYRRSALYIDPRHYNAWYGLGSVLMKQEKYELGEYHFKRALAINGRSSVLHCCLASALHAQKRNAEALISLNESISADQRNPLAHYEKARVLMSEVRLLFIKRASEPFCSCFCFYPLGVVFRSSRNCGAAERHGT